MCNRSTRFLEIEGSRFIVFEHSTSPITGSTSLWKKTGNQFMRAFVAPGVLKAITQQNGSYILDFGSDPIHIARALFQNGQFTGQWIVRIEPFEGNTIMLDGLPTQLPVPIVTKRVTSLQRNASETSVVIERYINHKGNLVTLSQYAKGTQGFELGKKGEWSFVLFRVKASESHTTEVENRGFGGNVYEIGWVKSSVIQKP